jgi:PAS domain S-box-containing protein
MRTFAEIPHKGRTWMWAGLALISGAAIILLLALFGPRSSSNNAPSALLTLVLITLLVTTLFQIRLFLLARREQREKAKILASSGQEFQSIFDATLDAILILDDNGICLEANPSALSLLGVTRTDVIGQSIQRFHSPIEDFGSVWRRFLDYAPQQGEVELVRKDGSSIFVEYTASGNYLPSRHVAVFRDITLRKQTEAALRESDERFQQMADNIEEIYWMLDAETKQVLFANPAYETITGRSLASLRDNPNSYQDTLHPEDRDRVLARLDEATCTGHFDEEFRIVRPDHLIRWVSVRAFPVRDSSGVIRRLVGITQDVSARKAAEDETAKNLALAESAWAEAEAFYKTTLALTQNLRMDCVLDTLLESLLKLIPCESARVLLVEADTHLFLEREVCGSQGTRRRQKCPDTFDATDNAFLIKVLATKSSLLIPDTSKEPDWSRFKGHAHMQSWLCVPLVASQQVLGVLSLGDRQTHAFTTEHLRLAKSLAVPAAVAIQNARLYECAEIYGAELQQRLDDLQQTERALQQSEHERVLSEEKFTKVFRSSPIAFSITTVAEGRFIDVNEAFERRYGHSRQDLLGRTVFDIGVWDNPAERFQMLREIKQHGRIRNRVTRFRSRCGEVLETVYSADIIRLEGAECLLAVSEALPESADRRETMESQTRRTLGAHN